MQKNLYANTARFYDLVVSPLNPAIALDIDFYKKLIPPRSRVLEIGCGTGRVAIELYRHGCSITGMDLSESMLAEFEKKLDENPELQSRIALLRADMTAFDLGMTFGWIIFPFRVFQALQDDRQRNDCLAAVRQHMDPNSRAVISMFNPDPDILARWGRTGIIDFDIELRDTNQRMRRIQNQIGHDAEAQVITTEHLYQVFDDQGIKEEYPDRLDLGYVYPEQASGLFRSRGFFIEESYGGYNFEPLLPQVRKEQIYVLRTTDKSIR